MESTNRSPADEVMITLLTSCQTWLHFVDCRVDLPRRFEEAEKLRRDADCRRRLG